MKDYLFPVSEKEVFVFNEDYQKASGHKCIYRDDTNEVISILSKAYKLVTNEEVVIPTLAHLDHAEIEYEKDPEYSFVENHRMRLDLKFPNIMVSDSKGSIRIALSIRNSYDMSEGVRFYWAGYRGTTQFHILRTLGASYKRHTKGYNPLSFAEALSKMEKNLPKLQEKITELEGLGVTNAEYALVEKLFGKNAFEYAMNAKPFSFWEMNIVLAQFIEHTINYSRRDWYQKELAKRYGI